MNLNYEKRLSPEELMARQTEIQEPTQEMTDESEKMMLISEQDFTELNSALMEMKKLAFEAEEDLRRTKMMVEQHLAQTKALAEEQKTALTRTLNASREQTEKTMRQMKTEIVQQVGSLKEKASREISKHILTDDALWGLRLALAALPTILVLALSVYMGWLTLFR